MRLLMPTGGSPHSDAALRFGAYILQAQRADDIPTILTVIKHDAERPQANEILAQARQLLGPEISEAQLKIRVGHPAEEIIAEAREGSYDLVIVGERQNHRLVTRLLGSTATRVVEQSPCPVIIAKGRVGPPQRILLCDSGGMRPSVLNRFASQFVDRFGSKINITVLHVMSQMSAGPRVRGQQLRANAAELIRQHTPEGELLVKDVQTLEELRIHSAAKVRHGLVVDEILDEARSGDYDLVVIGDYHGQGWERLLLENLAHQIVVKMDRPVLVVR